MMSPAATTWEGLPDDCWETIFGRLDDHKPVSLVNKRFLNTANLIRTILTISSSESSSSAPHLCTRFPNIKTLHLSHTHPDLDGFIRQLAQSNLPHLQSLHLSRQTRFPGEAMRLLGRSSLSKTLRTLSCTRFDRLDDDDLFVVADSFSYLRRLELDHRECMDEVHSITDQGILTISVKLKSLISLAVGCNQYVTDGSFRYLSSNCPLLTHFKAKISSKSLVCLEYFCCFASLSYLKLVQVNISKYGLAQLSRANLNIWKLVLRSVRPRTVDGAAMCRFLRSCRSLRHLKLKYLNFTEDTSSSDFVASIPNVQVLIICNVRLPVTILFNLLESCPSLEEFALKLTYVKVVHYKSPHDLPIHTRLRKLILTGWGLNDEILMLVASICPNLTCLLVGSSPDITERGIQPMRSRIKDFVYPC